MYFLSNFCFLYQLWPSSRLPEKYFKEDMLSLAMPEATLCCIPIVQAIQF